MEEIKENSTQFLPLKDNNHGRKKLPYDFWQEIGSPRYVVAPMVDNSDLAFRLQTRKYKSELTFTQMLNSNIFVQSKECRQNLFQISPEDRPLFAQLAGHDPETMLTAAKLIEDQVDAIDINLGCPQTIAKRGRYGAYLMEELELLDSIVRTMVNGLKIPVTCKTRIYKDFDTSIRLCETLVNAGASVLTIHGRTREEKGHFIQGADWEMIRRIKEHFSQKDIPIPIIANGGIENMDDVQRCLEYTKVDAVMTSEAILENPAIFSRNLDPHGLYRSQLELAEEYLDYCDAYPVYHIKCVRSHIMKIVYRYLLKDIELRNTFAQSNTIADFRNACQKLRQLLSSKEEQGDEEKEWVSWYNRHRVPITGCENVDEESNECGNSNSNSNKNLGPKQPWSPLDEDVMEDALNIFNC